MYWRAASLCLFALTACKITPVGEGGGGSGGGSNGGGGEGGSEPTCTAVTDCEACRDCAADGPCKVYFDVCFNNASCVAIDGCLTNCGALPDECWETCRAQNPAGTEDYDAARGCIDCGQCQDACASDFPCGD
jgi:hypothetical protein